MSWYDDKSLFTLYIHAVQGVAASAPELPPSEVAERAVQITLEAGSSYVRLLKRAEDLGVVEKANNLSGDF